MIDCVIYTVVHDMIGEMSLAGMIVAELSKLIGFIELIKLIQSETINCWDGKPGFLEENNLKQNREQK